MTDIAENASQVIRVLSYCEKHSAEHHRPMWQAAAMGRLTVGLLVPYGGLIEFPTHLPLVLTVSDDVGRAYGPDGFNQETLRPLIQRCGAAVVITAPPHPFYYAEVVDCVLANNISAAIIETKPGLEGIWIKYLAETNPSIVWGIWGEHEMGFA